RTRALYEEDGATKEELDQARASAEETEASLEVAIERLRQSERQLAYTTLRAPVDGAVSEVPVEIGENVSAGQGVVILQTGGNPEVEVAIPEVLIAGVEEGARVEVEFDALRGDRFEGVIVEVGVAPSTAGSAFPVTVALDAEWDPIRPGLAARVSFRFESADADTEGGVVVPASAIGHDQKGHFVFLVEKDDQDLARTVRRDVAVGPVSGSGITVRDGLVGGETLVVAGVPRVRDGLAVRVLDRSDWF
ncbi:MAG: efflux RND transporter periplasmic adaptor subunit, partial [Myxococcota bacterium]